MSSRPTTAEQAVEFFLERRRAGEDVDLAAFTAEHPELEPDLSTALRALVALERVTPREPARDASLPVRLDPLRRIGAFRIVREIGHGGMGVVLEAIEERLNRRVALKVLPPELLASPSARSRFRREAELAARLDHSGIATIYGAGTEGERPWIAMRYVEGSTLAQTIAAARAVDASCVRLSLSRSSGREATLAIASLLAQVARALHSAHEQGVVHRDIKPSNVIVQPDGSPVLLDFGLAFAEDPDGRSLTRTGEAPGTPAYLAPETVDGAVERPDAQSDVYALGVMLYECLTLRRPFDAPTRVALYRSILTDVPLDPRSLNRSVTRDLAVVTAAAMERDRSRRYRTALAFAQDLEACVQGRTIAARPVPWHGRILHWVRREPRQASLAGLLGATAIALTLFGGNYWASRDVVRAAEKVAREGEREHALSRGYLALQSDTDSADASFVHALELDPQCLEALAGRVLVRLHLGKARDALALLEEAPATPGFDALRANCRLAPIGQDAVALSSPGTTALDLFLIGVALEMDSDREAWSRQTKIRARAVAMFNEAVVCAPSPRSFMHVERAIAAGEAGDEITARSAARSLLALWPDSYDEVFAAGRALAVIDPPLARPILERAARLNPSSPFALQALGNVCRDLGDFGESERWCWLALDCHRDAETYNALGVNYTMRGCFDDAIETFTRALAVSPKDERVWLDLGITYAAKGELQSSILPFEQVIALDPTNAQGYKGLGFTLYRLGDVKGARAHLEGALALDPEPADTYTSLAEVLEVLGEEETASQVVAAGLVRHPTDEMLLGQREQLDAGK